MSHAHVTSSCTFRAAAPLPGAAHSRGSSTLWVGYAHVSLFTHHHLPTCLPTYRLALLRRQGLSGLPPVERLTMGALLWQLLRQLLAARKGKGKGKPLRLAAWLERSAAD
eukprot:scaffold57852_cov63-Phaeocystis_antarctica.AAC.8